LYHTWRKGDTQGAPTIPERVDYNERVHQMGHSGRSLYHILFVLLVIRFTVAMMAAASNGPFKKEFVLHTVQR